MAKRSVAEAADRAERISQAKADSGATPEGKPKGRPSKYNAKIAQQICVHLAEGHSLRSFCEQPDAPDKSTVMRWLREHDEFRNQYVRAREEQAEVHAEEIVDIADNDPDPVKARLRVEARKWVAARLLPKRYGDKSIVNVNADHQHHHTVEPLSESAQWLAKLLGSGADSEAPKPLPN